jgi:CHAT domain-containing protein
VAEALYIRFAAADVEGFKQLWADGVTPARTSEMPQIYRCLVPVMFQNEQTHLDGDRGEVTLVAVLWRIGRPTGRVTLEIEHATVGIRRAGDGWRVDRWTLAEDELVSRVVATKSDDEARALVRQSPQFLDAAFYRGLRRRSSDLLNRRNFDALAHLTAAMRELGVLNADAGIVSTSHVIDAIAARVGDKPDLDAALSHTAAALELAETFGDADALASALVNRGLAVAARDGNLNNAIPFFERVLAMQNHLEDEGMVSRAAMEIAAALGSRGDYRACFPYIERAREIAARMNSASNLYGVETTLADIYAAEGDLQLAIPHALRARELADTIHFAVGGVEMTEHLARYYQQLGRRREFLEAADEVLTRAAASGGPDLTGMETVVANVFVDRALDDLQQNDPIGAGAAAEKALTYSERVNDDGVTARVQETLARVRLAEHRYREAVDAAERSIEMHVKQKSVARSTPWLLAAQAHLALGDRSAAYSALSSAVDFGEQQRDVVVGSERQLELSFEPTAAAYSMLVTMLLADHREEQAFLIAEKARARTLLDILASERSSAEQDILPADRAEEERLEQRLVALNRAHAKAADVEKVRVALESFRAILEGRYPRLRATRSAMHLASLSALSPLVARHDRALVEYLVGSDALHLFIVTGGPHGPKLTVRSVPIGRTELAALVEHFSAQLAGRDALYRDAARRLHRILLEPALKAAGGATVLSIVPDDVLWRIPFEALLDGRGRFAVERGAFHYAPSAAVLLAALSHTRDATQSRRRLFLAFGNPTLPRPEKQQLAPIERSEVLMPIPEAEREVRTIGHLFEAGHRSVYTGAEALESRSKEEAPRYAIVHFATHGVMDDANPMYSRVLLARRKGDHEDGALEAREMMQLRLSADLVVLSACDTARGELHAGEGLIGMTWALFAAGCPSVVASQWRVASHSTELLMETFYRRWMRDRSSKAEALRRARLALLRNRRYRHPYYWAPFVLVGGAD